MPKTKLKTVTVRLLAEDVEELRRLAEQEFSSWHHKLRMLVHATLQEHARKKVVK